MQSNSINREKKRICTDKISGWGFLRGGMGVVIKINKMPYMLQYSTCVAQKWFTLFGRGYNLKMSVTFGRKDYNGDYLSHIYVHTIQEGRGGKRAWSKELPNTENWQMYKDPFSLPPWKKQINLVWLPIFLWKHHGGGGCWKNSFQ